MRHVSRTGVLVSATLLIVATGCATKGWVREEMGKQEAQVGQRIGQVTSGSGLRRSASTSVSTASKGE